MLVLILSGLLGFSGVRSQEKVEFTADAPKVVAVGETFRVSYSVNAKADSFSGPKIEGFLFSGPMLSTSMSTQIINNQVTQSASYTYNYTFQAAQEGVFTLPPAIVVVKGKSYQSEPLKIEVLKGNTANQQQGGQGAVSGQEGISSDDLFVKVEVDRTQVFKGEHIVATIRIYTRINLARFGEMKMPSFNGFWSQEIPTSGQVNLERTNYNGRIYNMGIIRKSILVPQQTGTIRIEPFEIECFVNVPRKRSRSPFDDFFNDGFFGSYETMSKKLVSPPVDIRIKPYPADPPAGFTGAVGKFSLTTSLDKTTVKTNEAINLKVVVKGNGNLKLIELPQFRFPADLEVYDPKITDNFDAGDYGISGSKVFEFLIIPRHAGDFEIPQWTFSYFDPSSSGFKAYTSEPLRITVQKGENDNETTLITTPGKENIRVIGQDIRFIVTDKPRIKTIRDPFFGSKGFVFAYMIPLLVFILVILLMRYRLKNLTDLEGIRYRRANVMIRKHFSKARQLLTSGSYDQFLETLLKGMWGYMGDKFNMDLSEMNKEKISEILASRSIDEETIRNMHQVLDSAEFMRYAPGQVEGDYDDLLTRSEKLVLNIEKAYRRS